jgi:hypothetical protein
MGMGRDFATQRRLAQCEQDVDTLSRRFEQAVYRVQMLEHQLLRIQRAKRP